MAKRAPLRKSWTCECGKEHEFPGYVYAHWDVQLVHTCDCGRKHSILGGLVSLRPPK